MRRSTRLFFSLSIAFVVAGCATSRQPDNTLTARQLVGIENGVRIDAQILGEQLSPGRGVGITYDVTNDRAVPVAVADIVPECTYDADTQTVTVAFGSEIPGHAFLPRLVLIPSGQKKSFSSRAVVNFPVAPNAIPGYQRVPRGLQVKLHFLADPKAFEQLIGIQERTVRDPKLADALLPKWLEQNETVITNVLPMRWVAAMPPDGDASGAPRRIP